MRSLYKVAGMLNVLIVEDDLTVADLLQEALEADGYRVTGIARTVQEAVQSAEQHHPDVAVIDIRLANGDLGTDVGMHLRKTTTTRVMFSTGNSNDPHKMAECGDAVMTVNRRPILTPHRRSKLTPLERL